MSLPGEKVQLKDKVQLFSFVAIKKNCNLFFKN